MHLALESGIQTNMTDTPTPNLPRKIAILGTATTSLHDAPFDDASWKIWDMSSNFQYGRRYDVFFEIHSLETLHAASAHERYLEFLKKAGPSLIAGHPSKAWPEATVFPLAAVVNRFGDYFTCTAAWMIAYALYLHEADKAAGGAGVGTIGLWGIDMAVGEEYSHQKPCAEYWVGVARGMGIDVIVAPQSPIARSNAMYGFDNPKLSREFTERLKELDKQITEDLHAVAVINQRLLESKAVQVALKDICHRWAL